MASKALYGRSEQLTPTEVEVMRAILAGYTSDKALASKFITALATQRINVQRIREKAGAKDRTQLVLMCLERIPAPACISEVEW